MTVPQLKLRKALMDPSMRKLCVRKEPYAPKWNERNSQSACHVWNQSLRLLSVSMQSYSIPKSPFFSFFLCWLWPRTGSSHRFWSIYGDGLTGRTFCSLCVADIWFMPAKAFPQEEVFWLISIAMSWGHFPFCDLTTKQSQICLAFGWETSWKPVSENCMKFCQWISRSAQCWGYW